MNHEGEIWKGREKLASFLFDGDTEKAKQLLTLIESFTSMSIPPEFKKLVMALPEEECQWCTDDGECLFYMPDSMFLCKGRCQEFTKKVNKEVNK